MLGVALSHPGESSLVYEGAQLAARSEPPTPQSRVVATGQVAVPAMLNMLVKKHNKAEQTELAVGMHMGLEFVDNRKASMQLESPQKFPH